MAVSVEVMFPVAQLTAAVQAFHQAFPDTPLRLYVEALGAVLQPLLDDHCRVAITGSLPHLSAGCTSEVLLSVPAVAVVSPEHPLATASGPILR
ncbi:MULTISPECIES: LysR substrate-binding domain-containing protein [Enterobacter]|uniref:LysR substrate-binding domain-containing protein n=1 Tax=Enterobacter quasihormaechei TaxID=2529382 RepID=A0ABU9PI64_9ENTR